MKIKIVYGVDMRLWKKVDAVNANQYQELLSYIVKTFGFDDANQFRITFEDDDDTQTTITCSADFEDAFNFAQKADKKSLKLYIADSAEKHHQINDDDEKKSEKPKNPEQTDSNQNQNDSNTENQAPSPEQINAFLSDDLVIDLLSDLFVSTFEALQASNFELSFIDTIRGIILSNNDKYTQITSNPIWPYFMNEILVKRAEQINGFIVPMIRMNGGVNSQQIKQWIPTMLNMMKIRAQNGGFGAFGCRGRRGRRGRGRRGRHWRGRRGWRGHHHHHGHHGMHHQNHENGMGMNGEYRWNGNEGFVAAPAASTPPKMNENEDDQIEEEAFEFTEELVAIMNMGFGNIGQIKKLLNEHKGNKQNVIQELVAAK